MSKNKTQSATAPVVKLKNGEALVLRCCRADGSSRDGFMWPAKGPVSCEDWKPTKSCGNGLHGWLRGEGDPDAWSHQDNDLWMVVVVTESDCVDLDRKVKFPGCRVAYRGVREQAVGIIQATYPKAAVIFGTATAGYGGTATAGDSGTATAGVRGTATAGDSGTATAGYGGTATAGDSGTATAGYGGTATAGYGGTATAGDSGTATAGDSGTATAGDSGTATAGDSGTATAGYGGTATAGVRGIIQIKEWDEKHGRYRVVTGYVGEDGIEAGVRYRAESGKLVKAEGGAA